MCWCRYRNSWPLKGTLADVAFENYSTFKSPRLPPMPHPLVPIRCVFFKKLYLHKQTYNHPGVFIFLKKLYLQADLQPTASAHAREFLFTNAMDSDSEAPVSYIHLHTHIYFLYTFVFPPGSGCFSTPWATLVCHRQSLRSLRSLLATVCRGIKTNPLVEDAP